MLPKQLLYFSPYHSTVTAIAPNPSLIPPSETAVFNNSLKKKMLQCQEPNTSEPLTNEKMELSSNRDPPPTKKLPINSLRHFYLHISHALYRNISSEQLFQHSSASLCSQHLEVRKLVSPHYPISAARINLLLPRSHLKGKKKQYLSTGSFT